MKCECCGQEIKNRFKKPTIDEVRSHCLERGNGIDPEAFVAHYEANGWMRGKTKIKSWKACIITWERNNEKSQPSRAKRLSDKLDAIARRDIEENGCPDYLD